jgi:hypothetical protein
VSKSPAASPDNTDFAGQLGQLAKFCRVMGFTPQELQVVINDPEARTQVKRVWNKVIFPPSVRLVTGIFAGDGLSLVERHRLARELQLDVLLSTLPERQRQVLDLMDGLSRDKILSAEEAAQELGITANQARTIHSNALWALRQHLRKKDQGVAQRVPMVPQGRQQED